MCSRGIPRPVQKKTRIERNRPCEGPIERCGKGSPASLGGRPTGKKKGGRIPLKKGGDIFSEARVEKKKKESRCCVKLGGGAIKIEKKSGTVQVWDKAKPRKKHVDAFRGV